MKRTSLRVMAISIFLTLFAAPLIGSAFALPAFPGAAGFGSATPGGRGGRVIAVTNLNDSGAGSFRAACEASGARIIVFRTGGTIRLSRNINIQNPYLTIAGQTAPGGGISLRGAGVAIGTHNVIMRGVRIRVGDDAAGSSPENRDALYIDNGNKTVRDIIVDQCSFSWAVDENISIWHSGLQNVTISNCIISEALYNSIHPKGPHSMGAIVGPGISNVTFYGNLFAHNAERNPRIQGTNVEVINNVVYNRCKFDLDIGGVSASHRVVVIGNVFKKGPSYISNAFPIFSRDTTIQIFAQDNIATSYTSGSLCDRASTLVSSRPFGGSGVTIRSASATYERVLANAGANPSRPDPVDARVIADVRNGTGRIIDRVSQVGGWPTLATGTAPVDSDGDGMPDSWEIARGLNPNSAADATRDRNNDGYTNIEEYINSFYTSSGTGGGSVPLPAPSLRIVTN
jgi:pectate lyase